MRSPRILASAILAAAAAAPLARATDIVPGPPTGAPELFAMRLEGGDGGMDLRFTLYQDRTFSVEDHGVLVGAAMASESAVAAFVFELRMSGFVEFASSEAAAKSKAGKKVEGLRIALSAYAGAANHAYAVGAWGDQGVPVQEAQMAYELLVVDVLAASGILAGSGQQ